MKLINLKILNKKCNISKNYKIFTTRFKIKEFKINQKEIKDLKIYNKK